LPDRRLRRVDQTSSEAHRIFSGSAYFPFIASHSQVTANLELNFDRRGIFREERFGLATRFPFGFLSKTRWVGSAHQVLVYPPVAATDDFFEVLPMITGEFETFVRGRGNDLYRIREYMPEDSARHVDWKVSAKSGSLKVREFSREDERKLRIVFDNPRPERVSSQQYEDAVALAASLAWHFSRLDTEICFVAQGFQGTDIFRFLRYLALVKPEVQPSMLEALAVSDDFNVILTTNARGSIPTELWSRSYFLFIHESRPGKLGDKRVMQQKLVGSHPTGREQ
jgi:hypothetical protein